MRAEDWYRKAWLLRELGAVPEATGAYEGALERAPENPAWRFEFAELLYGQGNPAAARVELRRVLQLQPDHAPAHELLRLLVRQQIESRREERP